MFFGLQTIIGFNGFSMGFRHSSPLNVIQPIDHLLSMIFPWFGGHSTIDFNSHIPSVVGRCDGFDGSFTSSCHWRCFWAFVNVFCPLQIDKCTTVRGWVSRSPPFPRSPPSRCPSTKWWDSLSHFDNIIHNLQGVWCVDQESARPSGRWYQLWRVRLQPQGKPKAEPATQWRFTSLKKFQGFFWKHDVQGIFKWPPFPPPSLFNTEKKIGWKATQRSPKNGISWCSSVFFFSFKNGQG